MLRVTMEGGAMVASIAAGVGYLLRALVTLIKALPGIVGPLTLLYGVWLVYRPAAFILAGLIVWVADVLPALAQRRSPEVSK